MVSNSMYVTCWQQLAQLDDVFSAVLFSNKTCLDVTIEKTQCSIHSIMQLMDSMSFFDSTNSIDLLLYIRFLMAPLKKICF